MANEEEHGRERLSHSSDEYGRFHNDDSFDEVEHEAEQVKEPNQKKDARQDWRIDSTGDSDAMYLTDLSNLQLFVARQLSALALQPLVEKSYSLNKLLEAIDSFKKRTIWSKMLGAIVTKRKKGNSHLD
jgi:hypothetical protein